MWQVTARSYGKTFYEGSLNPMKYKNIYFTLVSLSLVYSPKYFGGLLTFRTLGNFTQVINCNRKGLKIIFSYFFTTFIFNRATELSKFEKHNYFYGTEQKTHIHSFFPSNAKKKNLFIFINITFTDSKLLSREERITGAKTSSQFYFLFLNREL